MNRLFLRGHRRPFFRGGWQERTLAPALLFLVMVLGLTPLGAVEVEELAPVGDGSLGKSLQNEQWDRNAPVDIHSEEMVVDFERHQIVFKGNVKVLQSDFSLTAGEVTAVFGESADDIKKIVAEDNVKIRKAEKVAWGERAVYDRQTATIILVGDAALQQGRNFIRGEEIHFSLEEERMEVKGRVEAEFRLSGQKEDDIGEQGAGTMDQKVKDER